MRSYKLTGKNSSIYKFSCLVCLLIIRNLHHRAQVPQVVDLPMESLKAVALLSRYSSIFADGLHTFCALDGVLSTCSFTLINSNTAHAAFALVFMPIVHSIIV